MAVRLAAELRRAAAKDLALRQKMGVNLKPYHPFKRIHSQAPFSQCAQEKTVRIAEKRSPE